MRVREILLERASSKCEICQSDKDIEVYEIPPVKTVNEESALILCGRCKEKVSSSEALQAGNWHCLHQSIWSEHLPVKVVTWRLLQRIEERPWAQELLDQLYLDDDALNWAMEGILKEELRGNDKATMDSNGTHLQEGDSVTLIKDLDVKGAGFTAKRGTLVKNISLTSNTKYIEGRVNGIQIVLVAAYLKKA